MGPGCACPPALCQHALRHLQDPGRVINHLSPVEAVEGALQDHPGEALGARSIVRSKHEPRVHPRKVEVEEGVEACPAAGLLNVSLAGRHRISSLKGRSRRIRPGGELRACDERSDPGEESGPAQLGDSPGTRRTTAPGWTLKHEPCQDAAARRARRMRGEGGRSRPVGRNAPSAVATWRMGRCALHSRARAEREDRRHGPALVPAGARHPCTWSWLRRPRPIPAPGARPRFGTNEPRHIPPHHRRRSISAPADVGYGGSSSLGRGRGRANRALLPSLHAEEWEIPLRVLSHRAGVVLTTTATALDLGLRQDPGSLLVGLLLP